MNTCSMLPRCRVRARLPAIIDSGAMTPGPVIRANDRVDLESEELAAVHTTATTGRVAVTCADIPSE
jgi:hypothetical protein